MGSLAVSRIEAVDQRCAFHRRRGRRALRARSWRRWRPPSTTARSIRPTCCGGSAKSAPGAVTFRMKGRPICAAPSSRWRRSARSAARPPSWRGARTRWSGTSRNSCNVSLARRFGDGFASGKVLGGTGLSNPMKSFFGIEKLKLKGRKVDGGYVVRGALPWVSNLGPDHFFGTIFEREDAPGEIVMFLADCADPAITLQPCKPFLAMDGTGTYGVQFRDVFVPDELILAEQAATLREEDPRRLHPAAARHGARPDQGLHQHHGRGRRRRSATSTAICRSSPCTSRSCSANWSARRWRSRAIPTTPTTATGARSSRCACARGEASVAAAHAAMLHCGARGYLKSHRAQRRLREAYFVAIVTPATKQLRKMLADA